MTDTAAELKKLLEEIFHDELVEPKEREALSKLTKSMSSEEKQRVFRQFLSEKWGEAIFDDVLTGAEVRLLGHIMMELELEVQHLPEQARFALKDTI